MIYIIQKGTTVIGRTIFILLIISTTFVLLTVLGLIWQIKIENILPLLENGLKNPITCSLIYTSFNITPIFILTLIPKNEIIDKEKLNKRIIITYILANAIILLLFFITLSVLGTNLAKLYQYPEYDVLKKVSLIGFIERIESMISLRWTFYVFTLTIMGILFIYKYIKHTIKITNAKTNKKLIALISLIITLWGKKIFKNSSKMAKIIYTTLPILCRITLIILPLIIIKKDTKKVL